MIIQKMKDFVSKWAKKKRTYVLLALVLLVLFLIFKPKINENVVIDTVKLQDLESTVLASGEITSNTELSLGFNSTGVLRTMNVQVGDKVSKGRILATLDAGTLYGSVKSAEGSLKAAQARYDRILAGTSNEEINLAEVSLRNALIDLENTKKQQDLIVENAKKTLLNKDLEAVLESNTTTSNTAPTISGTYGGLNEGSYKISTYSTGAGGYFSVSGLSNGGGQISTSSSSPLGTEGLYITFPSGFSASSNEVWVVNIPNKKSANYLINLNALNTAIEARNKAIDSAQAIVDAKKAELEVKKAKARTFELDLAQADVISAEGQLASARANYENTILRAPAKGTITKVNFKLGELAEMQKEAVVLEDIDNLYLEANINESNIIKIKTDQEVSFTIDSFGTAPFLGSVVHIDPGATTTDGIVNYKIKIAMKEKDVRIKPGMNADLKILIDKKENVLVAPRLAITERDGKSYINIVTDEKLKKYSEREVVLGIEGDGNLVEIVSGVTEGEKIAFIQKAQ